MTRALARPSLELAKLVSKPSAESGLHNIKGRGPRARVKTVYGVSSKPS